MEILDAYREDGTIAGCDLVRGREIPKDLYHLVCEVLVKHKDGTYLLMQRDWNKKNYPGLYEATASGCALKGESSYEAALRELKEETGIDAKDLKLMYRYISEHTLYHGYICETNCVKESIMLQEGETISFLWLNKEEFLNFVDTMKYVQAQKMRLEKYLNSLR
ncbi:NUDIX hydrolase [Alloiococcus sp. CFN-8]|uniref:NUDIX hydrolase n=1 Tax=Alloiococcus sp. CFN-8 TaxID=3416081 RepID=UPI003CF34845